MFFDEFSQKFKSEMCKKLSKDWNIISISKKSLYDKYVILINMRNAHMIKLMNTLFMYTVRYDQRATTYQLIWILCNKF